MTQSETFRAVVVDDEPLARQRLRKLLRADPEIEMVSECADGPEAIVAITEHAPDLVFLDVQMPEIDGFDVLRAIRPSRMPLVVFVTAHDRYALKAFDVHALDYLLKPFDRARFKAALERAKQRLRGDRRAEAGRQTLALLEALRSGAIHLDRLVIRTGGRVILLRVEEIDWIAAETKYVRIHAGKDSHLLRQAIGALEPRLDPRRFVRIHRSTIVNLDRVKVLEPWFHGDYQVVLRDGTRLTLSRGCRRKLAQLLRSSI